MHHTLKFKITFAAFIMLTAIMSFSAWRDIVETKEIILDSQTEKARLYSERIEHGLMVLMLKNQSHDLQKMLEGIVHDSQELVKVRILKPVTGQVVASSKADEIGTTHDLQYTADYHGIQPNAVSIVKDDSSRFMRKLTVIRNQPMCYGCHGSARNVLGIMEISLSLKNVANSIQEIKRSHLFETLIGFLLIGGGFLFIIGLLIDRPIKDMIETIRRIESGDATARMRQLANDEFGLVAKSFNGMLDTLESTKHEIESCHIEQMRKAARLASLGEIIAGIAHEIKNPLAGISCAVQVFQSELGENDERRHVTSEILNHIKRLDSTVKGLLNYAKPKPPKFLAQKADEVLNKAIFFIYPEAKKHNIIIETEIDDTLPDVLLDSDQMQQVFLNLMINAVQAMSDGGRLKITMSRAERHNINESEEVLSSIRTERLIQIQFEDTGQGIDRDYLNNIFDPFFTRKSRGTGLGLSISQRIVQEHGGEITVRSSMGRGSTFTIYLPEIENTNQDLEATDTRENMTKEHASGENISY